MSHLPWYLINLIWPNRHDNEQFMLDKNVIKTFSPEITSCVICLIRKKSTPIYSREILTLHEIQNGRHSISEKLKIDLIFEQHRNTFNISVSDNLRTPIRLVIIISSHDMKVICQCQVNVKMD